MKKFLSFFLAVALVLALVPLSQVFPLVQAQGMDETKIRHSLRTRLAGADEEEQIQIIIRFQNNISAESRGQIMALGNFQREFSMIDGIAMKVTPAAAKLLSLRSDISRIELDLPVRATLDTSTSQIGTAQVQSSYGLTGKGVKVAVIDTGIADQYAALRGKVIEHEDFTGEGEFDGNGHGTHVASIIASSDPTYKGNAPGVQLLDAKALDSKGDGTLSSVIAALEWAVAMGADVGNLSLGAADSYCDGTDSLSDVVNEAINRGVVMVVAAGNDGPLVSTINTPGCAVAPITVGAINDFNSVAVFSSRGPTASGAVKPDVMAPGKNITGLWFDGSFQTLSGTSQSTPHVVGVVALLLELKPNLSHKEIKDVLMKTGNPLAFSFINTEDQKIVNAIAAVNQYYSGQKIDKALAGASTGDTPEASKPINDGNSEAANSENDGNNTSEVTIKVSDVYYEDLSQARHEWLKCSKESGSDEVVKNNCLEAFLDVQENYQLARLSSLEVEALSSLRTEVKILSDEVSSNQNLDDELKAVLILVINEINGYLYAGLSAGNLEAAVKKTIEELEAGSFTQSSGDVLRGAHRKEVNSSRMEKFERSLNPFGDVDDIDWFYSFVTDVKQMGCVSGYVSAEGELTGEYGPANYLTVAESLKVILECSGKGQSGSSDAPETLAAADHWARGYYLRAEQMGLTIASNPDENPDRPITRGEFIQEIIETLDISLSNEEIEPIFDDVPVDNPFAAFIYSAYALAIISGDSNSNLFRPNDPINRAELAKVVLQAI